MRADAMIKTLERIQFWINVRSSVGIEYPKARLQVPYTYKIVRFHFDDDNEVIKTGLSLSQAQAHCKREDSHNLAEGWFDGYQSEEGQSDETHDQDH